jgi:hypothetical protein
VVDYVVRDWWATTPDGVRVNALEWRPTRAAVAHSLVMVPGGTSNAWDTEVMSRGVIVGSSSRSAVGAPVVLIETAQTVERVAPIFQFAKRLLSNPLTGGLVGGAAQAWEDSGRSLTTAQRIDRVAIAAGIGVTVAAVGVVAIAAGAPLLFVAGGLVVLGVTADLIAKPWIFERRGYGR